MSLIDRYILTRFLANFAILFALLFVFAVAIDLILSLDRFIEVSKEAAGEDAGTVTVTLTLLRMAVNFQSPRFFQFYAYLHGLVAIGAMAFTLAQMHRYRELVAILAAGVSMHRIAMPFIVGVFALSLLQLVNQEYFLPRVAPLLLRGHAHIGQRSVDDFPVRFTPDGNGNLLQSPSFDPRVDVLTRPTILERDSQGRTVRRITASSATWTDRGGPEGGGGGWRLVDGLAVTLHGDAPPSAESSGGPVPSRARSAPRQPIDFYETDLSPRVLIVRRFGEYAAMLSLRQISQMLETPGVANRKSLARRRYSRFSGVLVNVLVMWLVLPTFLLRQPGNLLLRSVMCAGIAIPALLGAAVFMMADLPGISPAAGVFLPVVVLIPIVLGQWTYVKT